MWQNVQNVGGMQTLIYVQSTEQYRAVICTLIHVYNIALETGYFKLNLHTSWKLSMHIFYNCGWLDKFLNSQFFFYQSPRNSCLAHFVSSSIFLLFRMVNYLWRRSRSSFPSLYPPHLAWKAKAVLFKPLDIVQFPPDS